MTYFFDHLGDVAVAGGTILAYLAYRSDQKKAKVAREEAQQEQFKMHAENKQKFETLVDFQKTQVGINSRRDDQINELKLQTALLTRIAETVDTRLTRLENRDISGH